MKFPHLIWRGNFQKEVFRVVLSEVCADGGDVAYVVIAVERLNLDAMGGERWEMMDDDARRDEEGSANHYYVLNRVVASLVFGKTVEEIDKIAMECEE